MRHLLLCFTLSLFLAGFTCKTANGQGKTFTVTAVKDGDPGSLRDIVGLADANPGHDTIKFEFNNAVVLNSDLTISSPITIDGSASPGWFDDPKTDFDIQVTTIQERGIIFAAGSDGSSINDIHFGPLPSGGTKISIAAGVSDISIDGCQILTNSYMSEYVSGNGTIGIAISGSNVKIGVKKPNIIHGGNAVVLTDATNCQITKNMINLAADGTIPVDAVMPVEGNHSDFSVGVVISGGSGNQIESNWIGFCNIAGIFMKNSSHDNILKTNTIGYANTDPYMAPSLRGIYISDGSNNIIINNNISYTTGAAIELASVSAGNKITSNEMRCNVDGIVLGGGNNNYAAPVFDKPAYGVKSGAEITGTAQPNDKIELYTYNDNCGFTNGVQGSYYFGETSADASGKWTYVFTSTMGGQKVTALAISSTNNNTSTFSLAAGLEDCSFPGTISPLEDDLFCSGAKSSYDLSAYISNEGMDVIWTTTGTGQFENPNSYYTAYSVTSADSLAGSITFTVSAVSACPIPSQSMTLTILPAPTATIIGDEFINVCKVGDIKPINLNGIVKNAEGSIWQISYSGSASENGTFGDQNSPVTTYTPSQAEIDMGYDIMLTLEPLDEGPCGSLEDAIYIRFNNPITVEAGEDAEICSNNYLSLYGYTSYGPGQWTTTGTGSFVGSVKQEKKLSAITEEIPVQIPLGFSYHPSKQDAIDKTIFMIYTSTDNGCGIEDDTLVLTVKQGPDVEVTSDTVFCKTSDVNLTATMSHTPKLYWSSYSTGYFAPIDTALNVVFHPSQQDKDDGFVWVKLTSEYDESGCGSDEENVKIYLVDPPVVNAGADQYICQGNSVSLVGSVTGIAGTKYKWTTTGKGSFSPSADSLKATYVPSAQDIRKVALTFFLKATQPVCKSVSEELFVVLLPLPDIGQGTQQQICPANSVAIDAVDPELEQFGYWKVVSGSGVFADSTDANPTVSDIDSEVNVYRWTIIDSTTGCVNATDYTVYKCYQPDLTVYNAVSPNGDGIHDFFEIEHIDAYPDNKVTIYNRWGDAVFKIDGYDNREKVFTGRSNVSGNNELPDGTYYYMIEKDNKLTKGFLVLRK